MITVLAGGVGAARFLSGLTQVVEPKSITVIVNTGDDACFHGLHVSPDIDAILYTLAGMADEERAWGIRGDTFHCLEGLRQLGHETWFNIGDRDFATHIHRTMLLRQGRRLSQVTQMLTKALGLDLSVLPMSDDAVATKIITPAGTLDFQEYFVKHRAQDRVRQVRFAGAETAVPAPGVMESLRESTGIILAPSNPIISIGPILAVGGVRDALCSTTSPVVAISPVVGGKALKGPADHMLTDLGVEPSAFGVAGLYKDFLDCFVLDRVDAGLAPRIESLGIRAVVTNTIMSGAKERVALATEVLHALGARP